MKRIAVVLWLALVFVVSMHWVGQANQTPAQGAPGANAPRFTGKSTVMEGKELTAARRSFEAGARTFWHSHDKGQLLLVEEGRMRTQKRGGRSASSASVRANTRGRTSRTGTARPPARHSCRSTSASAATRSGWSRSPTRNTTENSNSEFRILNSKFR